MTLRSLLRHSIALLIALLLAGWAGPAAAQSAREGEQEEPPLVVESDEMVVRDTDQKAVYRGNVVATKGDMVLRADRLVVQYTDQGIQYAHAYGEPVTMDRGDRHGRAREAVYDASDRSLLLMGKAHLEEGPNVLEGGRIRYYLDARRTEVYSEEGEEEEGRARAVFQPGQPPGEDGQPEEEDGEKGDAGTP